MNLKKRLWLLAISWLLLLAAPSASATEEDSATRAAELASQAASLYEAGDVHGAIERFHEAMSFVADPAFAFNLAQLYDSINNPPMAHRFYGRYIELYPGAPNRDGVNQRMAVLMDTLTQSYAQIVINTTPTGATITLLQEGNRLDYGVSPTQDWVSPGPLTVEAMMGGYQLASAQRSAVSGVRLEINLTLNAIEEERAIPVDPPHDPPEQSTAISTLSIIGWAGVGLGTVLTALGVFYWLEAADLEEEHNAWATGRGGTGNPPSLAELEQLGVDAVRAQNLGNGLGISGILILASGAALLIADMLSQDETGHSTIASPVLLPNGVGFVFSGWF